jgi:hypothetical protein
VDVENAVFLCVCVRMVVCGCALVESVCVFRLVSGRVDDEVGVCFPYFVGMVRCVSAKCTNLVLVYTHRQMHTMSVYFTGVYAYKTYVCVYMHICSYR